MAEIELAEDRYIEFLRKLPYGGFAVGRVLRIRGSLVTVILSPYGIKGKRKGKRIRIHKKQINGIIVRKNKVIKCQD